MIDTTGSSADKLEQQFGNYRLVRPLGTGGFAEVYLGEHIHLYTLAAIKILHTRMTAEEREDFRTEALTIAHLKHPNIVRVLEFGFQDTTPFLVMDYAPNGSMRSHYKGSIPLITILPTVKAIAAALDYAHQQNIVHRDIKPDNILLGEHDEVLLSDFGIAVAAPATGAQHTQDTTGTPAYMAPEQFQGKPRPASDQYALAVTVYEWLCGKRPFDGDATALGYQHVHDAPPSLCTQQPTITPALERVVFKALAKDPHQRFESVTAFADALEQVAYPVHENAELHAAITVHEHAAHFQDEQECFLCLFAKVRPHADMEWPCVEKKLQGHLISAQERVVNDKLTPCITVDLGTKIAVIALAADYYRDLIRDIIARGKTIRRIPITVYHLPAPTDITEYKGKPLYRYIAYSNTLAVLEPDTLLNITDLSQADYCNRKYLLNRLVSSPPSTASIRGNLIHTCFTKLLKHDPTTNDTHKSSLELLRETLEEALTVSSMEMALANISADTMRIDVQPHLESLAVWYDSNRISLWGNNGETHTVRAETFLLVPEIGLRGRLDVYWEQPMNQSLLELKTGSLSGTSPKSEHRQQVHGYQALLAVRQDSKMNKAQAQLLYSGTPGQASGFGLRLDTRTLQHITTVRNTLILSHATGTPPAPPAPRRCTKCSMLNTCERVSSLLDWQPPQPIIEASTVEKDDLVVVEAEQVLSSYTRRPKVDNAEDRALFTYYYNLLQLEGKAGEDALALLWKNTVEERIALGKTLRCDTFITHKRVNDGWEQSFTCDNQSELREGDEILLSRNDPVVGEVLTGTIMKISAREITVWTRELLEGPITDNDQILVDSYGNDLVHVRTLQNLLRWLDVEQQHLRDLVAGRVRPRFIGTNVPPRKDFNQEQNIAVERAVQMQDYLLIQGPPGTGKTSVIAEIVKRLTQQGQRVLLAAFTNQAVDNMLRRLDKEGFHDYVRLGHERSVHQDIESHLLNARIKQHVQVASSDTVQTNVVLDVLSTTSVLASTTATWSSDKYTPQLLETQEVAPMQFDVAIIDEASQLTIPAILGALRFVKRFILVGDDKQLPPLVLSKEAAEQGLADSLFSMLKRNEEQYTEKHQETITACVALKTQYRMNRWISHFSSTVFYEKQLVAHESAANRRLSIVPTTRQEPVAITRAVAPEFPLVFLDVRGEQENGALKASNAEALAVRAAVQGLLARGIQEEAIGIIALYRAQVANIRRTLFEDDAASGWTGLPLDTPLSVDTVDRFQGGERSVIIMSFATTSEPDINSQRREFLTNGNRLNVALTRAQHKMILVGCVSALERLPIFDRLITYCRSMKTVIAMMV